MRDPLREGERWLTEAGVDVAAARALSKDFAARACFLARQAAEKAVKAILYASGARPVLGHSLGELGGVAAERSAELAQIREEVAKLDRYYIPTRYPNGLPEGGLPSEAFDVADAAAAISTAESAVAAARDYLEGLAP